ncbi:SDR family oxidoreductase [Xanthobacter oligotrophicus]|uniref:SDR family oxidoreductase n=1 Tax=Xanthobacter oligotrophicus TaxID=2607286 RepID=A0ABW6ZYE2_9HYPH
MSAPDTGWLGLRGSTCVVTGAGGGIGRAVALAFAQAGANLALADRNPNTCAETKAAVEKLGGRALALQCDISEEASIASAAAATLAAFGGADILVNNAGILRPGGIDTVATADWEHMLKVNLTGYFLTTRAFGAAMLEKGAGAIVHISSIAASEPQPFSGAYSPGKAAVSMLSRQIAFEWGPRGVRSNVVSPGLVRTPLSEPFYTAPGIAEKREAMVPVRRIGRPSDIADVAVFLASGRASYVNGQEIVVDGGLSQTLMSLVPRPGFGEAAP